MRMFVCAAPRGVGLFGWTMRHRHVRFGMGGLRFPGGERVRDGIVRRSTQLRDLRQVLRRDVVRQLGQLLLGGGVLQHGYEEPELHRSPLRQWHLRFGGTQRGAGVLTDGVERDLVQRGLLLQQ